MNGQSSSWANVLSGIPQGSLLGPLFVLICINDLSDDTPPNIKLFAGDISLFSALRDKNFTAKDLNDDSQKIRIQAFQWKIGSNPDLPK